AVAANTCYELDGFRAGHALSVLVSHGCYVPPPPGFANSAATLTPNAKTIKDEAHGQCICAFAQALTGNRGYQNRPGLADHPASAGVGKTTGVLVPTHGGLLLGPWER